MSRQLYCGIRGLLRARISNDIRKYNSHITNAQINMETVEGCAVGASALGASAFVVSTQFDTPTKLLVFGFIPAGLFYLKNALYKDWERDIEHRSAMKRLLTQYIENEYDLDIPRTRTILQERARVLSDAYNCCNVLLVDVTSATNVETTRAVLNEQDNALHIK